MTVQTQSHFKRQIRHDMCLSKEMAHIMANLIGAHWHVVNMLIDDLHGDSS